MVQATCPGTEWSSGYYSEPIPAVHEDKPQTFLPDVGKTSLCTLVGLAKLAAIRALPALQPSCKKKKKKVLSCRGASLQVNLMFESGGERPV